MTTWEFLVNRLKGTSLFDNIGNDGMLLTFMTKVMEEWLEMHRPTDAEVEKQFATFIKGDKELALLGVNWARNFERKDTKQMTEQEYFDWHEKQLKDYGRRVADLTFGPPEEKCVIDVLTKLQQMINTLMTRHEELLLHEKLKKMYPFGAECCMPFRPKVGMYFIGCDPYDKTERPVSFVWKHSGFIKELIASLFPYRKYDKSFNDDVEKLMKYYKEVPVVEEKKEKCAYCDKEGPVTEFTNVNGHWFCDGSCCHYWHTKRPKESWNVTQLREKIKDLQYKLSLERDMRRKLEGEGRLGEEIYKAEVSQLKGENHNMRIRLRDQEEFLREMKKSINSINWLRDEETRMQSGGELKK